MAMRHRQVLRDLHLYSRAGVDLSYAEKLLSSVMCLAHIVIVLLLCSLVFKQIK